MKPIFYSRISGFTLPEMTMAIAFAAVLIVAVFGVMGVAQFNANDSSRKSTQARISQELVAEILLNDWSSILDYQGEERYFDSEGNSVEVVSEENTKNGMWAYRARIDIEDGQARVPGADDEEKAKGGIPVLSRRVTVRITNGYLPDYDFEDGKRHRSFSTWVAKTNKI